MVSMASDFHRDWKDTSLSSLGREKLIRGIPVSAENRLWSVSLRRSIPTRILWRGFLINTLLYSALTFAVLLFIPTLWRKLRGDRRSLRGACRGCGYDIGELAVSGTVNDVAVSGATPLGLALALIVAEGFARADLEAVLDSIGRTAKRAGVPILTGDTKVVGRGQGDGVYITTTALGRVAANRLLHPRRIRPGDVVLINGGIGEHGLAVMLARELPEVQSVVRSDVAPLNDLIAGVVGATGEGLVFMRDPTRSGVAGVAADIASQTGLHVELDEPAIPVKPAVRHAADMLGLDPLEVANEGKVVAVVRPEAAEAALAALRAHPLGADAAVIGRITEQQDGLCEVRTAIGGCRILTKPYGEQLPRIC